MGVGAGGNRSTLPSPIRCFPPQSDKILFLLKDIYVSILLKEPFALKNSETVYFTSIFSTPSYSDITLIDNFDLTFFYFYFVVEVLDTIKF